MTPMRKRRSKPQKGYIFKASGWWFVRYRTSTRQPDGTFARIQKAAKLAPVDSAHRRPSSVRDLADQFLVELDDRSTNPKGTTTLTEFADEVYFANVAEVKRPSTLKADRARWNYHLKPRCGHIPLNEFRTSHGQALMHEIANDEEVKLSQASLRQMKSLMSAIFKHARQQEYIDTANPMRDVIVPRSRKENGHKTAPRVEGTDATSYYTKDEVNQLIALLPSPAAEIIAVAAYAGLRRGEINGLRWEDYRDDAPGEYALYISRSWWEGETTAPKTAKSAEPVPVIAPLAALLNSYRESLGNLSTGWMFPSSNPESPVGLNNVKNRLIMPTLLTCVHCGESVYEHTTKTTHKFKQDPSRPPWKGYHAFRRGLGTLLYSIGVSDKLIQRILRHSNVNVTMASYVKAIPEDVKEAMKKLEQVVMVKADEKKRARSTHEHERKHADSATSDPYRAVSVQLEN